MNNIITPCSLKLLCTAVLLEKIPICSVHVCHWYLCIHVESFSYEWKVQNVVMVQFVLCIILCAVIGWIQCLRFCTVTPYRRFPNHMKTVLIYTEFRLTLSKCIFCQVKYKGVYTTRYWSILFVWKQFVCLSTVRMSAYCNFFFLLLL